MLTLHDDISSHHPHHLNVSVFIDCQAAIKAVAGQPRLPLLDSIRQPQGPLAAELHCITAYYSERRVAFSAAKQKKLSPGFLIFMCVCAGVCYFSFMSGLPEDTSIRVWE